MISALKNFFRRKNKNESPYSTSQVNQSPPPYIDSKCSVLVSQSVSKDITLDEIKSFSKCYNSDSKNELARTVLTHSKMEAVLLNNDALMRNEREFEIKLKLEGNITNQKQSGRCWIFASTNAMRLKIMKKFHLEEFELSQNYIFFYDKIEKANTFLQLVIDVALQEDDDSRLMQHLFKETMGDGGSWNLVINLIEKYGLVPKSAFPETIHSENSTEMNWLLTNKVREFGIALRRMVQKGTVSMDEVLAQKQIMMGDIYKIVVTCLGEPPKEFDWRFRCKKGHFHAFERMTPKSFYDLHLKDDVNQMVTLIHNPLQPYFRQLEIEYSGNIYGSHDISINVPMEILKEVAATQLKNGEPVTFSCDVSKFYGKNTMDMELFNYNAAFGLSPTVMNRSDRQMYGESSATHEMVFTGVHFDSNGKPLRWRVENSWGDSLETTGRHAFNNGSHGFEVMNDNWFGEYVFDIIADTKYLKGGDLDKILKAKKSATIVLPYWS
ncbi:hypothetical protein HK099_007595 [Clydaea vesicula]|uniref:Cysteine proteinase 1, mitochondrial n=1 Tax=Clydaea vesicula TaxID=447962 RepID=A0AAD5U6P8_9FUNG|nr:hypothetical protein HK099_007595 [Clydaea vesicula]